MITINFTHLLKKLAIGLIQGYRYAISPLLGSRCRFYPTCSAYGLEAFTHYGFLTACKLTITRLLKCHPWHPGGVDLVPKPEKPQ